MKLTVLGSSSATPTLDRYPSCQILTVEGGMYMIDCGEGSQFRMNQYGIKKNKINAIFISHLHGDHYYGLIGLLTSMSMHERTEKLTIVAPQGLQEIIEVQCRHSSTIIRFEIEYIVFDDKKSEYIYEDKDVKVSTIPLLHKITTCGFLFEKKYPERSFIKEKIANLDLSNQALKDLRQDVDAEDASGVLILSSEVTALNSKSKRFAYCSDNMYHESFIDLVHQVDLLYHEATFLEEDIDRALFTKHSTARQAGLVAKQAQVKQLLIGHYSARYHDIEVLLEETKTVFDKALLAIEGHTYEI